MDEADTVFRNEGVRTYREYQRKHENDVLAPGIAAPHWDAAQKFTPSVHIPFGIAAKK